MKKAYWFADMSCLRQILDVSKHKKFRNEYIRQQIGAPETIIMIKYTKED